MRRALLSLMTQVCGAAALADAPVPPPAALPTPYTAEQIRDAWQPGFRVEMKTTEAGTETLQRMTVLSVTPETGTIRNEKLAANGELSEPPLEFEAKWTELRDHARFPEASATRERAECRSQLGAQPGWRYEIAQQGGPALTMCFADATPGPPVEWEMRRGGALVSRTEHVSYRRPSGAEEKR